MLKTHAVASEPGTYDGMAMWQELRALTSEPSSIAERREHDRIMEAARDNMLPDGCSAQDYADKVKTIVRDYNPYSERPYEGAALGHYIIGLMPRANAHDKRIVTADLLKQDKMDDMEEVIARCTEVVRDSATTTAPIATTTPLQQLQIALAQVGVDSTAIANFTASLKSSKNYKKGKNGTDNKDKTGDKQANKFRLPEGQTCPEGTCNLNHAVFSPGSRCFRSPHFKGPLDKSYRNNAKQVARIEADRKANAVRMQVPYVPLLPSTPKAAASLAMADDSMEDSCYCDVFQLPAAVLPVLPMLSGCRNDRCMPCDISQWVESDTDSDGDVDDARDVPFAARSTPTPTMTPTDTPTKTRFAGNNVFAHLQDLSQWDDDTYESYSDGEPPPPPVKPSARLARRSPSASRAATRPASVSESMQVLQAKGGQINTLISEVGELAATPIGDGVSQLDASPGPGCAGIAAAAAAAVAAKPGLTAQQTAVAAIVALTGVLISVALAVRVPGTPLTTTLTMSAVTAAHCLADGAAIFARAIGPSFVNASTYYDLAPTIPLPLEELCLSAAGALAAMVAISTVAASCLLRGRAQDYPNALGRAANIVAGHLRAVAARALILVLVLFVGPRQGGAAISTSSASRASSLISVVGRSGACGMQAAHAASAYLRSNYDVAILPDTSTRECLQLGRALGLSQEPLPVMNMDTGTYSRCELGTGVRPRGLHLADSGAGIHAVNDMRYVVPGSL